MARKTRLSELLGLNINGDLPDSELVDVAVKADKAGVVIWIGENPLFKDPFYVADLISDYVSVPIGFGIVSPLRRSCSEIIRKIGEFEKRHEVILGIAPGSFEDPKKALEITLKCLEKAKSALDVPVFCGCSSPTITARASEIADGILFNYCCPEFLRWIFSFLRRDVVKVAYAPSLILPSEFEQDLLLATAIVSCSSKRFVEIFGFLEMCREFSKIDFTRLISVRQRGGNLFEVDEFGKILKFGKVLLEKFAICGSSEDVGRRVEELLKMCDHVVLGDPFFRDRRAVDSLSKIQSPL